MNIEEPGVAFVKKDTTKEEMEKTAELVDNAYDEHTIDTMLRSTTADRLDIIIEQRTKDLESWEKKVKELTAELEEIQNDTNKGEQSDEYIAKKAELMSAQLVVAHTSKVLHGNIDEYGKMTLEDKTTLN